MTLRPIAETNSHQKAPWEGRWLACLLAGATIGLTALGLLLAAVGG